MVKLNLSLLVAFASIRPLYCDSVTVLGFTVLRNAISGMPSRPDPTPGDDVPVHEGSCVPKAVFKGEPRSSPLPGIVWHCFPSVRPMFAQVALIMAFELAPSPRYARYFAAMLPGRVWLRN